MLIILLMKLRTCLNSLLILYSVQTREKCTNVLIFCLGAYSFFVLFSISVQGAKRDVLEERKCHFASVSNWVSQRRYASCCLFSPMGPMLGESYEVASSSLSICFFIKQEIAFLSSFQHAHLIKYF